MTDHDARFILYTLNEFASNLTATTLYAHPENGIYRNLIRNPLVFIETKE
ncbi:hypothetical protein V7x_31640 [Crateriforma conspicua]|uniref:Uncharacterized protein n=1 Tax=Crateriforma conspicua TaxID=2527996 RepID=A0A5C6FXE3_9PLAN|nr:hypothetical protein V7x_31640 [Crateriforma conspicua]